MEHIALVLSLWLFFMSWVFDVYNIRSFLIIKLPAIIFAFIVALWYLYTIGFVTTNF